MTNTILLTDDAKLHGSQWLADIPLRAGSQAAEQLRAVQGMRAPITIGPFHADDAIVILADVTGDVETWRVYKAAEAKPFWSAPTIQTDGTKIRAAPGLTCVEHPLAEGESCPSWTITAETLGTDDSIAAMFDRTRDDELDAEGQREEAKLMQMVQEHNYQITAKVVAVGQENNALTLQVQRDDTGEMITMTLPKLEPL